MIKITNMNKEELDTMVSEENCDRELHVLDREHLKSIERYVYDGIEPGGFLMAVLCNDLKEACGRADKYNRRRIFEYVEYLYNFTPHTCWGSEEKVNNWLKEREENGIYNKCKTS